MNAVIAASAKPGKTPATLKPPQSSIAAASFAIPGQPAQLLAGPSEASEAKVAAQAEAAESQALARLRRRLTAVYQQQANTYYDQQRRLLGDLESRALDAVRPELRSKFEAYAQKRTPLVVKLANLAGFPDVNPNGAPPPAGVSPVEKSFWLQANATRDQIRALDLSYSREAAEVLAKAAHLKEEDELALLRKVEELRQKLDKKAIAETARPAGGTEAALHLEAEPALVLPPVPPVTQTLPPVAALPKPPMVDFREAQLSPSQTHLLLQRQLAIWLALNGKGLASGPGRGIPDETRNFENWRTQQQAGP